MTLREWLLQPTTVYKRIAIARKRISPSENTTMTDSRHSARIPKPHKNHVGGNATGMAADKCHGIATVIVGVSFQTFFIILNRCRIYGLLELGVDSTASQPGAKGALREFYVG